MEIFDHDLLKTILIEEGIIFAAADYKLLAEFVFSYMKKNEMENDKEKMRKLVLTLFLELEKTDLSPIVEFTLGEKELLIQSIENNVRKM